MTATAALADLAHTNALEVRGVVVRYATRAGVQVALDGVDLAVREGAIHGIIGASGAGKTTLLRCLATLERPQVGRIELAGRDVVALRGAALREARRRIGTVYQQLHLLPGRTAAANIALPLVLAGVPRAQREARVAELLGWIGLPERAAAFPRELSGGQRQRIAVARALAPAPRLLLCDEPTAALDPTSAAAILDVLRRVRDELGVTVVIVSHDHAAIARVCDEVTTLRDGRVVAV